MGKSPKRASGPPSSTSASSSSPGKTLPSPGFVVAKDDPVVSATTTIGLEEDSDLLRLCDAITARAHLLAPGNEDLDLMRLAAEVVKSSFDRALVSEQTAFPHLSTLLESLNPSAGPSTRSSSATPKPVKPTMSLALTPLQELTVEGMELEMVWEQMEMRGQVVVGLLEEMFGAGDGDEEGSDPEMGEEEEDSDEEGESFEGFDGEEEESDSDDGSDDMDEPFEAEEFYSELGREGVSHGMEIDDPNDDNAPSSEEEEDPEADQNKSLSLATFDKRDGSAPKAQKRSHGPPSSVDSTFFSLHDFHVQADEGEFEMEKALRKSKGENDGDDDDESGSEDDFDMFAAVESEEEDEEEGEDLDKKDLMYADFFEPPPREFKGPKSKETKGGKRNKGKGKPVSSDDEEPAPSPKKVDAKGKGKAIANPSATTTPVKSKGIDANGKRSVRFSSAVKVKTIAARGSAFDKLVAQVGWERASEIIDAAEEVEAESGVGEESILEDAEGVNEDDEEEEEDGEDDQEEEEEDVDMEDGEEGEEEEEEGSEEYESEDEEGRETINRLKSSLFDEDEPEEAEGLTPAASLSRHERRLLALSSQIAALEAENVGAKDWATKGEAKAKDRPVNSLLEEDLEYERAGKVVPVITEETTKTIEDLIKKRILDNQFDDVIRQRAIDPNAFLPSRFMELQDVKSNKSLAEIYEEDYTAGKEKEAGRKVTNELDADLEKKHAEIEELFDELSGKLDALSNARFTPKPPKSTITTITNVSSVTLESALPTGTSTSTLLAPEEVFTPDPTNEDRSDFTPSMKKTARQKRRKARASMAAAAEKFSKGAKGEKERATKELVGTKGVTVIGKGGKVEGNGLKRKRGDEGEGRSGISLKL